MMVLQKCGPRSCILYYILISIAYLQFSHFLSSADIEQLVCRTLACEKLANFYQKIMKNQDLRTGGPCDDFYSYVCHNPVNLPLISRVQESLEEKRKRDGAQTNEPAGIRLILSAKSTLQRVLSESRLMDSPLKEELIRFYNRFNSVNITAETEGIHLINNNTISVNGAYLQWPIYDINLPPAIQYGALVSAVGRELYHILDYNDFGNNMQSLQNPRNKDDMSRAVRSRAQCFSYGYNRYKQKEKSFNFKKHGDFSLTMNDYVSDAMGLILAYRAYRTEFPISFGNPAENIDWYMNPEWFRHSLNQKNDSRARYQFEENLHGNCTVLPELEHYDCDKLFFIAYASSLCENSSPISKPNAALTANQHPNAIRVNLAVANMAQFAQAFQCGLFSNAVSMSMQCDLWNA